MGPLSEFLSLVNVDNFEDVYSKDITDDVYFGMPLESIIECEKRLRSQDSRCIAYFSMEYGLASSFYNRFSINRPIDIKNKSQENEVFSNFRLGDYFFTLKVGDIIDMPIYSGGLGVLAGDTIKTMADYKLPVAGIGMLWNSGYFKQRFWFKYGQVPEEMHWDHATYPGLIPLKDRVKISLKDEDIYLRLWKYYVYSYKHDYAIPLILLDSNLSENSEKDRHLTDQLYRSDNVWIKIMQRVILGMGGVSALRELKYNIDIYHLNEGHAIFSFIEKARGLPKEQVQDIRKNFVYTCHTPVEAGHDRFSHNDLSNVLNPKDLELTEEFGLESKNVINLTLLSMNASSAINAVSLNHQKVMHIQFPKYKDRIDYVTNGVHSHTWISSRFKELYEKYRPVLGDIEADPMSLSKVNRLRDDNEFRASIWNAHQNNKIELSNKLSKWKLDKDIFTLCWSRRMAGYKRPSLILEDVNRLIEISERVGPIQIIFAGKAHPNDDLGFTHINTMLDKIDRLTGSFGSLKIIMLENYEIALAHMLTSSVDVWLNNPLPPFEASGTSGMKAILNAVLQISTLDGWIVEAKDSNIGRIFGYCNKEGEIGNESELHLEQDSKELHKALEDMARLYYETNKGTSVNIDSEWIDIMINCVATGGYFNTYRMLDQYKEKIWKIK
ncbi:MAG: alpha-glucan family phosphorylase [Candidatus Omnitrophota bacterium]|jgi:starch phosphorylase|nr:MAG: alpha-glucan family phosphorylase [Candidatus Omnitrophota bacterium]